MFSPRIKFEHLPVRHGDDRVRIGGVVPGIATEVADPDGWVWALLGTLDGTRTVDRVVADLVPLFPAHPEDEVREAIEDLVRAGYVEDAAEPPPDGLTPDEQERYERSRALFRWMDRTPRITSWEAQLLLRQARVVVVGIGGVGSTAALALAASGVGHLHCVDPDVVELSNLNRQVLYVEQDVGRPKVDAAVDRLRAHNSHVHVTGERRAIDSPDVLRRLVVGFDVLLLAADRPHEIRSWANRACLDTGTAWVHGGYKGPQINVGIYGPGGGPCYDCAYTADRERRSVLPGRTVMAPRQDGRPQAANAVTAGIAGSLAAHTVMSLITGAPGLRTNCEFGFNLATLQDSRALGPDTPRPDCPACG
ncbi:molybdopterin/thiamine biosynthesis adenylyltransferase [Saccharothrix tamanrassetensis]|uniref:Molybdopterin/thiamine biosynthesis adenylyltransferase n=1 Tax=Saccharothrix tamanrassetensis TaxID=1051531 RepID=A0A841CPG7_9PSEU|nr:ThiF family adenylyltransferase [Saccharothrix tamanrassetensis]MBB5959561.1 molybdopterin/thiamine biosynthesis adenylyltransferase [Saccharothrix tamanrassetensis]